MGVHAPGPRCTTASAAGTGAPRSPACLGALTSEAGKGRDAGLRGRDAGGFLAGRPLWEESSDSGAGHPPPEVTEGRAPCRHV